MLEREQLKKRLAKLSPEKQDALNNLLRKKGIADSHLPIIARRQASNKFPLSSAQQVLWSLQQLEPDNPVYNLLVPIRLIGSLNLAALEQSLNAIILRHEILRTSLPSIDGQPVQVISSNITLNLPVVDLRELPEPEGEDQAQRLALDEVKQPFDLAGGPLWRFKLLHLAEEEYILLLTIHHIIFDGKSLNIFYRELTALYQAFSTNQPSPLPKLSIQYADFACWEQQWLQSNELESQLAYWQKKLAGRVPPLELPVVKSRPSVHTSQGSRQSLVLPKNLTNQLKMLSLDEGATLFMTLLAGFKTLLYCYSRQEDILLASPVTGHNRSDTEPLIGYFNHILLMRTDLSGNPSFRELIGRVRQTALEAYKNKDVPIQKLVEQPNLARIPVSRGMFALHHITNHPLELPGLTVSFPDIHNGTANFDLSVLMEEKEGTLTGVLEYKTALFETGTINQMLVHFQTLLESLVANPEQHLSDLPLFTKTKPRQLFKKPVEEEFVAPRNQLELQLTKIWKNVLNVESISVKDSFLDLGGHSFLTINLLAQIEKVFGEQFKLAELFKLTTVEKQADWIKKNHSIRIEDKLDNPNFKQYLFFLGGFKDLKQYLAPEYPIYELYMYARVVTSLSEYIQALASRYVNEIRTVQPEGPYILGGVCFGGMVAYEIAQQLQEQGQKVAMLIFIDLEGREPIYRRIFRPILRFFHHWYNLLELNFSEKITYTLELIKRLINRNKAFLTMKITKIIKGIIFVNKSEKQKEAKPIIETDDMYIQNLMYLNEKAYKLYVPKSYSGDVILLCEDYFGEKFVPFPRRGWTRKMITGKFYTYGIPAHHNELLFDSPQLRLVTEQVKNLLNKALAD